MPTRHYSDFRNKKCFIINQKKGKKPHNMEHYTGMTTNIQCKSILNEEKNECVVTSYVTVRPLNELHIHHYPKKPQAAVGIKEQEMQNRPPTHPA